MKKSLVFFIILIVFTLTNGKLLHAIPYLVTQSQSFTMRPNGPFNISKRSDIFTYTRTMDLDFLGTPGSIVIGGEPAPLTSVSFDLTTELRYSVAVICQDGVFCDCYVEAYYFIQEGFGYGGLLFPDQDRILHVDYDVHIIVHDPGGLEAAFAWWLKEVDESPGQFFSLSANDYDLSFLDVDNFTVELQQGMFMGLIKWDHGDEMDLIKLFHYNWEGDLTITYEYEYTPAPIPEPGTLWLLSTGLIGLVGFRKLMKDKSCC